MHAILQTHDGYLWFGTEGGLSRFDGLQFTTFDVQNTAALKSNTVRALSEDAEGTLWIATAAGLTSFRDGKFRLFTNQQGLPSDDVFAFFQDRTHQLWALTSEGASSYRNGAFLRAPAAMGADGTIAAMAEERDGTFWLGTRYGLKNSNGTLAVAPEITGVQALLFDRRERLWIGTSDGLQVRSEGKVRKVEGLPSRRIVSLYEDKRQNIWIGTESGAAVIGRGDGNPVPVSGVLPSGPILCFLEDREGGLWTGTDADGVTVTRDQKFRTYGHADGVPDDLIRCLMQDRTGRVWVGTNGQGLLQLGTAKSTSITTAQGLSSNVILSLAEDAAGHLLVGTPDGLNVLDGKNIRTLTSADGLPDDFIRSILRDGDGSLWVGTRRGLGHIDGSTRTSFTTADGLPSDMIGALVRGRDGCLWIGTLRGLACFRNGQITTRPAGTSLPQGAISSLFEDSGGTLWVGTAEEGLTAFASGSSFHFPASIGLPQTILGITGGANRQLWITSPNGLFRVSKQELQSFSRNARTNVSAVGYGTADGLAVNAFSNGGHPTVLHADDGTLWFASTKGLLSMDDRHSASNSVPPPVVLQSIAVDDRILAPEQAIDLAPGSARVAFAYAGLSFVTPQKVRYRYRLEGFDRNWVEAGTRRVAYYTNLAGGNYRFVVHARNSEGIWNNTGASFAFRLRPHFYQTFWFAGLTALMIASMIYGVYRWRVQQVQGQFNAVLAERTRIAREIHDTLAQGFVAVSVQLELIHRVLPKSRESAEQLLQQTRTLVRESLAQARQSIWDLRSETETEKGLPDRLSQAVRKALKNTAVELSFQTLGAYRPLTAKIEEEMLRIAQEAVANVLRHSQASKLRVTLSYDAGKARIQVVDNGRGFTVRSDLQGPEGHYGLRGMRERAEAIGGSLAIVSSPDSGTQLSLEVRV